MGSGGKLRNFALARERFRHTQSLPKLYLEMTMPSYLTARKSRNLRLAAQQEVTEEWWNDHRREYELYISDLVLDEAGEGDAALAESRLTGLTGIPSFGVTERQRERTAGAKLHGLPMRCRGR